MNLTFCAACGSEKELHKHHLLPKSKGGSDAETNLITLCISCHGILHDTSWSNNHAQLVRDGISEARKNGSKLGPKRQVLSNPEDYLGLGNQPIDDVLFCLFQIEGLYMEGDISILTWGEISSLTDQYTPITRKYIMIAKEKHGYTKKHFTFPIVTGADGHLRKPNACIQKMKRMRTKKTSAIKAFQLDECTPKQRNAVTKAEIRRKNHEILEANKTREEEGLGNARKLVQLL